MVPIQSTVHDVLVRTHRILRSTYGVPRAVCEEMEGLIPKVEQPCVVAVVGRVKAGKSSFINALLGDDLATVGTTETTATINYFRFGTPSDPNRPVRCFWRNGHYEDVGVDFLRGLQGNDLATLQRADGIERLEYRLRNEFLRQVTLVDTPGTGAAVGEHEHRTAEYIRLQKNLRARHDEESRKLGETCDAVIYLIGAVARETDRVFLEEFNSMRQGSAVGARNAIGVMAKIDLSKELMRERVSLASKAAVRLKDDLNTVLPISAGLKRALDRLRGTNEDDVVELVRGLARMTAERREKLLSDESLFLELEDEILPRERRGHLRGSDDWGVFTTLVAECVAQGGDLGRTKASLEGVAGFVPLRQALEEHFFHRGSFLHCLRLLADARKLLAALKYEHLPTLRERERGAQAQQARFLAFIQSSRAGDATVGTELAEFVRAHVVAYAGPVEAALRTADSGLAAVFHTMQEHAADFEALFHLDNRADAFCDQEKDELRAILGAQGVELEKRLPLGRSRDQEYVAARQRHWRGRAQRERDESRRLVLERAVERLGLVLNEVMSCSDEAVRGHVAS